MQRTCGFVPEPVNPKAEAIMKSAGMTLEGHVAKQFDSESAAGYTDSDSR